MTHFGIHCLVCHSERLQRKRRSAVRYQECLDRFGMRIGEYRFFHLQCQQCKNPCYIREKHLYYAPIQSYQPLPIDERDYRKASVVSPQNAWLGTTASEYTLRISSGRLCPPHPTPYQSFDLRTPRRD